MIEELIVWRGSIVPSYQDELEEWLDDQGDQDCARVYCDEIDVYGSDENMPEIFNDTGGMFSDKRIILIGPECWKAPKARDVVQKFENMDCSVYLSMVYLTDDPPKYVNDRTTELRERFIDHTSPEILAPWIQEWMGARDVIVSKSDALDVAEHVGHDMDKLLMGLIPIANGFEGKVSRDILFSNMGQPGQVDIFQITQCMIKGDRAGAYEHLMRVDQNTSPFIIMYQISNRINALSAAKNPDSDLTQYNVYGGAEYYVRKESDQVSELQCLRALEVIGRTDLGIKGKSGVEQWTQVEMMVDNLCMIFNKKAMKSDGIHDDDILEEA